MGELYAVQEEDEGVYLLMGSAPSGSERVVRYVVLCRYVV